MEKDVTIISLDCVKQTEVPWGNTKVILSPKTNASKNVELRITEMFPSKIHEFHKHAVDEILVVVSGKMTHVKGEKDTRVITPGQVVYVPAGTLHSGEVFGDEQLRMYVIFAPPPKGLI